MESFPDEIDSTQDNLERNEIRSELSKMTFEELQKLKAKLGEKVYKEAMFGPKTKRNTEFKRKNKNRPREVSSKIKPTVKKKVKEKPIVDPRFNRLCGTFNEKHFQLTYEFLSDIRKNEKSKLKKMLKTEKNPNEVSKIKYLIQRMENQEREKIKKQQEKEKKTKEKEEQIKSLESGKKPYFRTKYEKKIVQLVEKYDDLKKRGKVQKYIEKKQKKQKIKEKQKTYFEVNVSDGE